MVLEKLLEKIGNWILLHPNNHISKTVMKIVFPTISYNKKCLLNNLSGQNAEK